MGGLFVNVGRLFVVSVLFSLSNVFLFSVLWFWDLFLFFCDIVEQLAVFFVSVMEVNFV